MNYKLIKIKDYNTDDVNAICEAKKIQRLPAILLSQRKNFIEEDLQDPYKFSDMQKAVQRIDTALEKNEKITIYGDYDADGVTATAVLYLYLRELGANVAYYIPNRLTEGYGLNEDAIRKISADSTKLIITVDNGIASLDSARLISGLGMDLIVTDHHLGKDEAPEAVAVLDCNTFGYDGAFHGFAGVGVTFKLICAHNGNTKEMLERFADIVTIGTIGDVMPIISENRFIVTEGLKILNSSPRTGIAALIRQAGLNKGTITSGSVAFGIVPRINAAGRLGSALTALELLITDDEYEANLLADKICKLNLKRQETEMGIFSSAEKKLTESRVEIFDKVIVVSGEGWHEGVIGIVAAKILNKFGKPTIVISENGSTSKGSGRSIDGFSLFNALSSVSEYLTKFGGHEKAAGFSIETEKIEDFKSALRKELATVQLPYDELNVDAVADASEINMELCEFLTQLEPYGTENEQPVFVIENLKIESISPVGKGNHLRITFSEENIKIQAMYFGMSMTDFDYSIGDIVNIAVNIEKNEYMGRIKPSLYIRDLRSPFMDYRVICDCRRLFEAFKSGEAISYEQAQSLLPKRKTLEMVYKFIREKGRLNPVAVCRQLDSNGDAFAEILTAIEIFSEMGLIKYSENNDLVIDRTEKVDLNNSATLKKLKGVR